MSYEMIHNYYEIGNKKAMREAIFDFTIIYDLVIA